MRTRKLKRMLREGYGKVPDATYFEGDMSSIRAYYDYRRDRGLDPFLIDEITWNDLDMDRVFQRINPRRSSSGEQYLYYMLRSPALDEESFQRRRALIEYAQRDPERRLRAELILARLGCTRRADLCRSFDPEEHGISLLLVYLTCFLLLIAAAVWTVLSRGAGAWAVMAAIFLNCAVHEFGRRRSERDYDTVNYVINMIFAVRKLRRLHDGELDAQLQEAYASLDRLRAVIRTGGVSRGMDNGSMEARERLNGFLDELHARGIETPDERLLCFSTEERNDLADSVKGMALLDVLMKQEADCLICYNDIFAAQFMAKLQEKGMRIPEDLGIIGFDNADFSAMLQPALTTLGQPKDEIGAIAARKILRMIAGNREDSTIVDWTLIERDSLPKKAK